MKRVQLSVLLGVLALLGSPAVAVEAAASRYRLLSSEAAERLERRLRSAAADGYHLVAAGRGIELDGKPRLVVLLERLRSRPAPPDYAVIAIPGGDLRSDAGRAAIQARIAEGYRARPESILVRRVDDFWLPTAAYDDQTLVILERSAPGPKFEYETLVFGRYPDLYRDLAARRREGFEILGMWNSGRKLQIVLERRDPTASTSREPEIAEDVAHRLLMMATRKVLKIKLGKAARQGYRVRASSDPATVGPPLLLLERAQAASQRVEYRFVGKMPQRIRKNRLARKLNKRARQGWRLSPAGTTDRTATLERVPGSATRAVYRTVSSRRSHDLPLALERAVDQGFRLKKLFVTPGETTLLLEKAAE